MVLGTQPAHNISHYDIIQDAFSAPRFAIMRHKFTPTSERQVYDFEQKTGGIARRVRDAGRVSLSSAAISAFQRGSRTAGRPGATTASGDADDQGFSWTRLCDYWR